MTDSPRGAERRQFPRFPLVLQVEVRGVKEVLSQCSEDLCVGGLFIRTERAFEPGERVPLLLSFPGLLQPLEIEVEVLRRRAASAELPAGVAVRLTSHGFDAKSRLDALLKEAASSEPTAPSAERFRMLLVDDDRLLAQMFSGAFENLAQQGRTRDFHLEFARNGQEALTRLMEPPRIDLVMTDLEMPVMNGFELLGAMRADARLASTPVAVMSALELADGQREKLTALGVGAVFQKPLRPADILSTVRALLDISRRQP
jgi:uncharacterized protein (TIGR02266 family)